MKKYNVYKSTYLLKASIQFTLKEYLLMLFLNSAGGRNCEYNDLEIKSEIVNKLLRYDLNECFESLTCKEITIYDNNTDLICKFLTSADYNPKKKTWYVVFDPTIAPYLKYHKGDISYDFSIAINLNNLNAIKLYELLKYAKTSKECTYTIENLRKYFLVNENSYKEYGSFKQNFIEKHMDAIVNSTDISFSYEELKSSHSVNKLKFKVTYNKANKIEKSIEKPKNKHIATELREQIEQLASRIDGVNAMEVCDVINEAEKNIQRIKNTVEAWKERNNTAEAVAGEFIYEYEAPNVVHHKERMEEIHSTLEEISEATDEVEDYTFDEDKIQELQDLLKSIHDDLIDLAETIKNEN